ncbi:MAG: sensor histidine kinase, partial [Salibacteraceae bacterium]
EDMRIDMSKAIPFGLMVSEILINAHKHAFNGRSDGEISIKTSINEELILLNIRDNGTGILKEKNVKKSSSLGMVLVKNFTDQLNATMKIDTGKSGTSFHFEIPMKSIES